MQTLGLQAFRFAVCVVEVGWSCVDGRVQMQLGAKLTAAGGAAVVGSVIVVLVS